MTVPRWCWLVWPLTRLAGILDERDTLRSMTSVKIQSMSVDEQGAMVMNLSHDIVPLLGQALAESFKRMTVNSAGNYVEGQIGYRSKAEDTPRASMRFKAETQDGGMEFYIVTVQKLFRPTPHELRDKAERELKLVEAALLELWLAVIEPDNMSFVTPRMHTAFGRAAALVGHLAQHRRRVEKPVDSGKD